MKQFVVVILTCLLALSSLSAQTIAVTGSVSLGSYRISSSAGSGTAVEFRIKAKIKNLQTKTLTFDTVKVYWQGSYSFMSSISPGNRGLFELSDSQEFEFVSAGHTTQLIVGNDNQKIIFTIALFKNSQLVAEVYNAELPDFKTMLADYERTQGSAEPVELKFSPRK